MSDIRPERPWRSLTEWGGDPELLTALATLQVESGGDDIGRVARVDRIEANVVTAERLVRVTDGGHGPLGVGDWVTLTTGGAPARHPGGPADAAVPPGGPADSGVRPAGPERAGLRNSGEARADGAGAGGLGVVQAVLGRHSALMRSSGAGMAPQTLAANIDEVLVVVPVDQPPEPARLERLLVLAYDSGARPRVVLTKSDVADTAPFVAAVAEAGPGVAVHAVSSKTGDGIDALAALFGPGRSAALIGVSGAGKSSLVNALVGDDRLPTGAVRAGDGRGRHTTTWRELVRLPSGGAVIDTPGLRSLGLWLDAGGIDATFSDVVGYAEHCRFSDCRHTVEPGCAVRAAVAAATLRPRRLASYFELRQEAELVEQRNAARLANDNARSRPR